MRDVTGARGLVVVSPHLDDAVLSAGGIIAATARRGGRVRVVTVFDGAPAVIGPDARAFHEACGLGDDAMDVRRGEDDRALATLGASPERLGLREALYRTGTRGQPVYAGEPDIFCADPGREPAIVGQVAEALACALDGEDSEDGEDELVLVPVGVGGHVDHVIVRRAAERDLRAGDRAWGYYEELPYLLFDRCKGWEDQLGTGRSTVVPLGAPDRRAKLAAAAEYRSQHRILWIDPAPWPTQVPPAERIWWP
ncbi:MAG TPA: PIG-L family deacetylase [Acidimicrobiales bacterium]|jgi:LmbE family N-acetylglucosaminyl deacetylase